MQQPFRFVWSLAATAALVLAFSAAADAGSSNYLAVLNAGQEVPVLNEPGVGNAFLRYDPTTGQLCWTISYQGLSSAETASHIHGPAAPGADASTVIVISPDVSPLGSGKQGCAPLDATGFKALKQGLLYINVHSMNNVGGELRGQIIPVKGK